MSRLRRAATAVADAFVTLLVYLRLIAPPEDS